MVLAPNINLAYVVSSIFSNISTIFLMLTPKACQTHPFFLASSGWKLQVNYLCMLYYPFARFRLDTRYHWVGKFQRSLSCCSFGPCILSRWAHLIN